MRQRTLTNEQRIELLHETNRHARRGEGFEDESRPGRAFLRFLEKQADYLLGVGPGKSVPGLRKNPPKGEVLLSSDYIERTMHPALGA